MRQLSIFDKLLDELQHGLKTSHLQTPVIAESYPARGIEANDLSADEQTLAAALMRVNNAGEVAAQGLYRGQALTARNQAISQAMDDAAQEETEHLSWCLQRLSEFGQRRSLLDGIWYWGSFTMGAIAGAAGDKWSLGFVKETEQQVGDHLERHLQHLPAQDHRSRAIVEKMREDELRHARNAEAAGAAELPPAIKQLMTTVSKVMTFTAYRF